jgi:DNA modification methylase
VTVQALPYLLLKATAGQIPLRTNSADLVIATPPYVGERRTHPGEYCTRDGAEFEGFMARFLDEAIRIARPHGFVLLHARRPERRMPDGKKPIVFSVLQKRAGKPATLGSRTFKTRYSRVGNFSWVALPIWLYRGLLHRYSRPGDLVVHLFSGSGNGGMAALEMSRNPVLIDLHYHRQVNRRLKKSLTRLRRQTLSTKPHFA